MKIFKCTFAIVTSLTLFSAVAIAEVSASAEFIPMSATTETTRGEAKFKDGSFAYFETHTVTAKDGRVVGIETEYRPADVTPAAPAAPIAKMRHTFVGPGFLADYTYEDLRNKIVHRLTVDRVTSKISMFRKSADEEKTGTIDLKEPMAAGQGVYFWLRANLEMILRGETPHVRFVVPALLGDYPFIAKLVKTEGSKSTIKVSIDNWLFNLFASKLEFDIDNKTKKLLAYRGTSNVADEKGKYRDVIILY
jgi:hypothetical protein